MKIKLLLIISLSLTVKFSDAQTQVTFYTTKGNFVVSMEETKRPITTANFLGLVKKKFYDGIIFHRVISGFMIQGGDPTGTGSGGSGVTIVDELTPIVSNLQKTIAMANSGANTGSSQFFINLVNNTYLNSYYPVFGTVISNFSVVQAIGVVPTTGSNGNPKDKPLTDVVMDSVRITFVPLGIDEKNNRLRNIDIFPNPITDESVISINSNSHHIANVLICNQLGEKVYSDKKNLSTGVNYFSFKEIQINDFPQGIYYLMVTDENSILQHRFIFVR